MNKNFNIKIGDFGISKQLNSHKKYRVTIKKAGTYDYIAPEILYEGIYNEKSDIWSLGCIIYELFTLNICSKDKFMNKIKKIDTDIYDPKWQNLMDSLLQIDFNKRPNINQVYQNIFFEGNESLEKMDEKNKINSLTNNGRNPKKNSFKKDLEMMNTQEKILIETDKTEIKFKKDETKNFDIEEKVYNLNNNICVNKIINVCQKMN